MLVKARAHLTYANVMASIAVFIALGAGAYAAGLAPNSVKSKHIKDGQVRTDDVADDTGGDALTGTDVATNSLSGADIDDSSLFGDDSLSGADIDESSLDLAHGASAVDASCSDDDQDGEICAQTSMTLSRTSDVFVVTASSAVSQDFDDGVGPGSGTDPTTATEGLCAIVLDGVAVPGLFRDNQEIQAAAGAQRSGRIGSTLTGVLESVPAGEHQFALRCTELDGDVAWAENQISAVVIGDE